MSTYVVINEPNKGIRPSQAELQAQLEKGSDNQKIDIMRAILLAIYSGDPMPDILMHVIRFVMPSRNKQLKKLLHLYWEVVPKLGSDGKLRHEMILVINAIRNDLQHPNEYIRGSTLRFLAKLREHDLIEPLVPSVRACLDHRHAYVRKNAVFAIMVLAQTFPELVPDAADIVAEFLDAENDATCKRNAFVALTALDRDAAYTFFQQHYTDFANLDELIQLAFIQFIIRDALVNVELTESYAMILTGLIDNASNAVAFDAASALSKLSVSPAALVKAASKYINIAVQEADNNIKVIALHRVSALNERFPGSFASLTMDVLLVLNSPDVDVRRQALDLVMNLLTSRNADSVVRLLKRELAATVAQDYDKNAEYRQAIIAAIHKLAIRFPEITHSVIDLLLDFLGDFNTESAIEVVNFIREIVEFMPSLRAGVIKQLVHSLDLIKSSSVFLGVLWVLGEYSLNSGDIGVAWAGLRRALGPLPIRQEGQESETLSTGAGENEEERAAAKSTKPKILSDGTYATESALEAAAKAKRAVDVDAHQLRKLVLSDKFFLAGALAASLTKLVIRSRSTELAPEFLNGMTAEALLIMTSLLRANERKMDDDSADRIYGCIQLLLEGTKEAADAFVEDSHAVFVEMAQRERNLKSAAQSSAKGKDAVAIERPVQIRLLESSAPAQAAAAEADAAEAKEEKKILSQLKQIYQLTGYSDPIYAEAHMTVNQFDISLDVMIFNQTTDTLQKLNVEFFTIGDMKVIDEPSSKDVAPMSFYTARTTIKVSSADSGVIFGNIVYEGKTSTEATIVILNEIRLNILDYIKPAKCSDKEFQKMWAEFEWENKVAINNPLTSLTQYLRALMKETNMGCLTQGALDATDDDECGFLSANLYARSSFGEDALANLSIRLKDDVVIGHLRIRSKTQGPALSIGDRVADMDRGSFN